jgi:hypothetical protein
MNRTDTILILMGLAALAFTIIAFISATSPEHLHAAIYLPM